MDSQPTGTGTCNEAHQGEEKKLHLTSSSFPAAAEMEESGSGAAAAKGKVSEKLCRRCKESYEPAANTPRSCRFHPSFFVCRRHDDQKRYYELRDGDPPYAAKFYDCCGAEDPDAPGCTTDFHRSYDD